jgi:hypothetical protein
MSGVLINLTKKEKKQCFNAPLTKLIFSVKKGGRLCALAALLAGKALSHPQKRTLHEPQGQSGNGNAQKNQCPCQELG